MSTPTDLPDDPTDLPPDYAEREMLFAPPEDDLETYNQNEQEDYRDE